MKIPLIISALALGIFNSSNEKLKLSQDNGEINQSNEALVAYIDKPSKVYLNDIDSDQVTEDTWNESDIETIKVTSNLEQFNDGSRYLKIKVPIGIQYGFTPEIMLGDILTSVDTSNYKTESILATSGVSKFTHNPNSGEIIYSISDNVKSLSLDLLFRVDTVLWDKNCDTASSKEFNAIEISIGDNSTEKKVKLNKVNLNKANNSSFYLEMDNPEYIAQGLKKNYNIISYVPDSAGTRRILKNLTITLDYPYIESSDGTKTPLSREDFEVYGWQGSEISFTDDKIIISSDNISTGHYLRFGLNVLLTKSNSAHLQRLKININGASIKGLISEEVHQVLNSYTISSSIMGEDSEYIISKGAFSGKMYNEFSADIVNRLNVYHLRNLGGKHSNSKELKFEYPYQHIGVKTVRLPFVKSAGDFLIRGHLYQKNLNNIIPFEFILNKPEYSGNNHGYILHVEEIISKSGLNIVSDNVYIKELRYDIGELPPGYDSNTRLTTQVSSSGGSFGTPYEDTASGTYITTVTLTDNVDSSIPPIISELKTTVEDSKSIYINNINRSSTSEEIKSGEDFRITGSFMTTNTESSCSLNYIDKPVLYLKLPTGIEIDFANSKFMYGNEILLSKITDIGSDIGYPERMNVYRIDIDVNSNKSGVWNEYDLSTSNPIKFDIKIKTNKSTSTMILKDYLFLENRDTYMNSHGYPIFLDKWDFNQNGNKNDRLINLSKNISIISSIDWLLVDTVEENKAPVTISDLEQPIPVGFSINNSNGGIVSPGNFEYYIPVPKTYLDYPDNFKSSNEEFNFDMILNEPMPDVPGFEIFYSTDNINFSTYSSELNLELVSMIKIVNVDTISDGESFKFETSLKVKVDSWSKNGNSNTFNICGVQTYTKNGNDTTFVHKTPSIVSEVLLSPKILTSPSSKTVNISQDVQMSVDVDLGIPYATGKWQEKRKDSSTWVDLSETSTILNIRNTSYDMDGTQYRYVVTNKGYTVESAPALLTVADNLVPIIELTEFKDDDGYKIRVDVTDEDSGVSHIILPDGRRIDSDTFTMDAAPDIEYIFKAYDLAGNESIAKITIIGGLVPKTVTGNLDVYIKSRNMLSLSLSSNSILFEDFNGTENLEQQGALELTVNSSLPYEINAYLEGEIQNSDKTEIIDKSILNLKESSDADYKEFTDIKTKLTLVPHGDAGNDKLHSFDFKLNGGIAHKKDVYKASIKLEVNQK